MAQLELSVVLNLANFRTQLGKLAQASAAYYYPINLTIDQKAFRKQLAAIGNIKTTLRINTNLEAEIQAADRLAKALQRVQQVAGQAKGNLPLGTKGLSRTTGQGGFSAAQIKTLFNASIQGGLLDDKTLGKTRAQMVAALGAIGRDSIKGLLDGLESSDAQLQQAAQTLGKSLIASFKDVLGIASPSKEFKKIGDDAGKGFEQGLLRAMEIAEQSATRQMQRMLDRLARMALMMGGMSASQISQQVRGMKALSPFDWQATTPSRSGAIGPSSTGRLLPGAQPAKGLFSPVSIAGMLPGRASDASVLELNNILAGAIRAYFQSVAASVSKPKLATIDITPLLSPGKIAGLLPGRPSQASILELNNILAGAIREYFKSVARDVKPSAIQQGMPALAGSRIAGFLAPGMGRVSNPYATGRLGRDGETRAELFARREREARMRSALRGVDVMEERGMTGRTASPYSYAYRGARPQGAIVPYAPGGAMVYSGPGGGGLPPGGGTGGGPGNFAGRGGGPGGGFNMPKLPGAGLVREVGEEFAFATKQVLLYGQAYKLLGIAQAFPAQVGEAVGALQSFRNTIKEISPSAQEAGASSQFILDIVEKYNTPLQSARDGFVKLYASMQPAGFTGNEIRDLFLGISQTAATFGMSADKVDRVNYAFAQMASKGQVMSEELKGQLGDVLPGAMAIFAEAAGFEGPEAITKFSKALEDGTYKGAAMKTLLTNVGSIMRKEFGPGAEGAARTFQGVMNRMQNSMKLLYESFEPVAVGFLNAVVMPMTSGIKTLTDGFNAFFKGQAAQTAGGSAIAQQLNSLKPAFEGILANIKSLIPSFQLFGSVVFNAAKLLASIAGNPIVGFLFNVYTNVLLVNTAFSLLGGKILLGVIASVNATIARLVALSLTINALGVQTTGAKTALAGTQLQMLLLQRSAAGMVGPLTLSNLAMAALAGKAALVVGGLVLLGKGVYDTNETFRNFVNNIGGVIASDFRDAVDGMAEDANSATNDIEESYKNLLSRLNPIGNFIKQLFKDVFGSTSDSAEQSAGQSSNAFADFFNSLSSNATAGFNGLSAVINNWWSNLPAPIRRIFEGTGVSMLVGAAKYAGSATTRASAPNAQATGMFGKYIPGSAQKKIPSPRTGDGGKTPPLPVVGGGGGTGEGAKGKKGSTRESQIPQLMLRLEKTRELSAIELKIADATLTNNTAQLSSLELTKQLIEFKYEAKELDLQQLTAQEKSIARKEIALRAEQAILASQLQLQVDLKKERDAVQEGFTSILAGYQEEANYQQMYLNLINQGIRPSLAKAQIEVEKRFKDQEKQLETLIEQNKAEIASLEIQINLLKLQKNLSKESKDQLADAEARLKILQKELELRTGIKAGVPDAKGEAKKEAEKALAPKTTAGYLGEGLEAAQERLVELTNTGYQVVQAANAIGDAFGNAFKGVIDGSMTVREALAGFFQSIADHFADMVAQMVAEWLKAQVIKGFMNIFSMLIPGGGGAVGDSAKFGINTPDMEKYAPLGLGFANGGIAPGGFTAFANGGMVTGPTMGLVGEGRYNEAIVPLPNGKSIPVELGGASQGNVNVVVNVDAKGSQVEGNEAQSKQLGRVVSAAVQAEIVKQQRPGGLLSSSRSF